MAELAGPSLDALRATCVDLMVDRIGEKFRSHLETAAHLERYYLTAAAVGVPRGAALEVLHEAQGAHAGSTPTLADLDAARERVIAHALSGSAPMSKDGAAHPR
jgi:hypothetical protein